MNYPFAQHCKMNGVSLVGRVKDERTTLYQEINTLSEQVTPIKNYDPSRGNLGDCADIVNCLQHDDAYMLRRLKTKRIYNLTQAQVIRELWYSYFSLDYRLPWSRWVSAP